MKEAFKSITKKHMIDNCCETDALQEEGETLLL